MKIFNMLVLCITSTFSKQQFRLCLILLDLYGNYKTNRFDVSELHKHPWMTKEIANNLDYLLQTIVQQKIMCKNQWQYTIPSENFEITKQEPIYCLFEYLEIVNGKVLIVTNTYYWEYLNTNNSFNVDIYTYDSLCISTNPYLFKFYLWVRTWELSKYTKCNVDWLEMYFGAEESDSNGLGKLISFMKKFGIELTYSVVDDTKFGRAITYIVFTIVKPKRKRSTREL